MMKVMKLMSVLRMNFWGVNSMYVGMMVFLKLSVGT